MPTPAKPHLNADRILAAVAVALLIILAAYVWLTPAANTICQEIHIEAPAVTKAPTPDGPLR